MSEKEVDPDVKAAQDFLKTLGVEAPPAVAAPAASAASAASTEEPKPKLTPKERFDALVNKASDVLGTGTAGAATTGAVAGTLARRIPLSPPNFSPADVAQAQAAANAERAGMQVASEGVEAARAAHAATLPDLLKQHQFAEANLGSARTALEDAVAHGQRIGLPGADTLDVIQGTTPRGPTNPATSPWAREVGQHLSAKQLSEGFKSGEQGVGQLHAAGQVPKSYLSTVTEAGAYAPTQTGRILVPQAYAAKTSETAEAAAQKLKTAQAQHTEAMKAKAAAQAALEGHGAAPRAVTDAERVAQNAAINTARAEEAARSAAAGAEGFLPKAGRVISKIPFMGALSGGAAGLDVLGAIEEQRKGNPVRAASKALSAVGGGMGMIPTPYTRLGGLALQAPEMAWGAYDYLNPPAAGTK